MFADNDWYGHKKIILEYCKIKKKLPIFGTLQHGYNFNWKKRIQIFKPSKYFKSAPYYSWNDFLKKNKKINSIPIGAPFIYLDILNKKKIYNPKGTLVFPSHSNEEYPQLVNHKNLIIFMKKKFKPPYKVSLFHTDFLNSITRNLYKKNNFQVFCSGHRGNDYFLKNVYRNIANSEFVLFTEFMTPTLYAMFLRKKIAIFEEDHNGKDFYSYTSKDYEYFKKKNKNFFSKIFLNQKELDSNYEFSKRELGFKYILKRDKLIKTLNLNKSSIVLLSRIVKFLYDLKHGKKIRGVKLDQSFKRKLRKFDEFHFKKK